MKLTPLLNLPHRKTQKYSDILCDWLEHGFQLGGGGVISGNSISHTSADANQISEKDRSVLHATITRQMSELDLHESQIGHLKALQENNSRVVVTAHQPVIFGGPLYIFYKIASTISLARQLTEKWNTPVVPVYWMGTEDHDVEEISGLNVFGKSYRWEVQYAGMSGRMHIDEALQELIKNIESAAGSGDNALKMMHSLKQCYSMGKTLGQANKQWIHTLFGAYGLLIIDPDDADLKTCVLPKMEREIFESVGINGTKKYEERLGNIYPAQVFPREINLFYARDNFRARLVREQDDYMALGTEFRFSESELRVELAAHPDRFSPNVVIRPIYQQSILPAVAFVGGPAEIAYWLQVHGVFEEFELEFPALVLRDTCLLMLSKMLDTFRSFGYEVPDLFENRQNLTNRFLEKAQNQSLELVEERQVIERLKTEILQKVTQIDKSLGGNVEAEWKKVESVFESIEGRLRKSVKKREEDSLQKLDNILEKCFPAGGLQERSESGLQYLILYGNEFIAFLIKEADPLKKEFKIFQLDS